MTSRQLFACQFCGRHDFKSQRGLNQHQRTNRNCSANVTAFNRAIAATNIDPNVLNPPRFAHGPCPAGGRNPGPPVAPVPAAIMDVINMEVDGDQGHQEDEDSHGSGSRLENGDNASTGIPQVLAVDGDGEDVEAPLGFAFMDDDSVESVIVCADMTHKTTGTAHYYNERFKQYVQTAISHFVAFVPKEQLAIKMLDALRRKRATLDTYDTVLDVFYRHLGIIDEFQTLSHSPKYVSREKTMRHLALRYNIYPQARLDEAVARKYQGLHKLRSLPMYLERPIVLPHSKAHVDIIHFDFREQLVALLTDPRYTDLDFIHHNDDPLAPPPVNFNVVGETITSRSYRESYKKYITKPGQQMLLPIIFYIDATTTGQFTDLSVEALKFSLGILTNEVQ